MWESDVPMPVWILGLTAFFNDSAATSISFLTALVKPQTLAFFTIFEISTTELKSKMVLIENYIQMMKEKLHMK